MDDNSRGGSTARPETSDHLDVLPARNANRSASRSNVAGVSRQRGGIPAADEGGGKVSNNTCKCSRCERALQDRLWTVRDAIAALNKEFPDAMFSESRDELDGIIARLYFRESELERLISEMQRESAK